MALDAQVNIADLERNWLEAETTADQYREQAQEVDAALEQLNGYKERGERKRVQVLLTKSEELHAQHAAAEKAATDAFDLLWSAKERG